MRKMCFRPGCSMDVGDPGSVEVRYHIGTTGKIGQSQAILELPFCSSKCDEQFSEEYPTDEDKIRELLRLVNKGK